MTLRLIQLRDSDGRRLVAAADENGNAMRIGAADEDGNAMRIGGVDSTRMLGQHAIVSGSSLVDAARSRATGEAVDIARAEAEGRLLAPIDHPDPAHCLLSGTGLTHLGSAEGRDKMHKAAAGGQMTDSMRMFAMGLAGGKPGDGEAGAQPEWFYKGDGSGIVATGQPLTSPHFALDGSEEPEIAGIYLIGHDGRPWRLGFALANEFSDHETERGNYLWLAHSKLRPAAIGAELLVGELPPDVRGTSRILRGGKPFWEQPFLSGEANMSHSIANLEAHHFKYAPFRRPGDVHIHFFGTATLSFADGARTQDGDVFEISAAPFRICLRNPLVRAQGAPVTVCAL